MVSIVNTRTFARSVSRPASDRLREGQFVAKVLSVFERVCNLLSTEGDVIALVTPQVGDGPLNVVIDSPPALFCGPEPGIPAVFERGRFLIGSLDIDLEDAAVWEPRPDWEFLRARRDTIVSQLPLVRDFSMHHAPADSLLTSMSAPNVSEGLTQAIHGRARSGAEALCKGWTGDYERLQEAAVELAGLGRGLTPAGDDFLAGAMLCAWLAHPTPESLCGALAKAAVPRTTTLSAALLQAAARGECSAAWHRLLAALAGGGEHGIIDCVPEILAQGGTSGADSLCGFLYFGF